MTLKFTTILTIFFLSTACKTTVKTQSACGDGFLDPGEVCDGSELSVADCRAVGYHFQDGPLACTADCALDLSACSGLCGDGVVQTDGGEHCEGNDLNGQSCQLLNLGGGTLTCDDQCHFDASGCEISAVCGDDVIHAPFEDCEGDDLDGQSCQSLGYHAGQLGCTTDCRFDLEPCATFGRCGDGILQPLYGERCEGNDLDGQTCEALGWYGGTLLCGNDCDFDVSGCEPFGRCGDGELQTEQGEECDGTDLGGFSCAGNTDYHGGMAVCGDDCRLDLSDCEATGFCGDLELNPAYEECDGSLTADQSCTTLGYNGGVAVCSPDCVPDISSCIAAGRCGDGIRQAPYEECDGADLGNNDCNYFDFYGAGLLACGASCDYDLTACAAQGYCGDGVIQSGYGEVCDGTNVGANSCVSMGHVNGGTLGCDGTCRQYDTSGCLPD